MSTSTTSYWQNVTTPEDFHENTILTIDQIFYRVAAVIIGLVTVTGNGILATCIIRNKKLQTNTNCFILGLAINDLYVGLVIPVILFVKWELAKMGELVCMSFTASPMIASLIASMLLQDAIAVERFIAIMKPLRYPQLVTRGRVITCTMLMAGYSQLVAYLPLLGWNNLALRPKNYTWDSANCINVFILRASYVAFMASHLVISMVGIAAIYSTIFYTARSQAKKVHPIKIQGSSEPSRVVPKANKGIIILAVMVAYFLLSWLLFLIVYFLEYDFFREEVVYKFRVPRAVDIIACSLGMANSAVNPYIYGFGNTTMRKAIATLFKCHRQDTADFSTTGMTVKKQIERQSKDNQMVLSGTQGSS